MCKRYVSYKCFVISVMLFSLRLNKVIYAQQGLLLLSFSSNNCVYLHCKQFSAKWAEILGIVIWMHFMLMSYCFRNCREYFLTNITTNHFIFFCGFVTGIGRFTLRTTSIFRVLVKLWIAVFSKKKTFIKVTLD